MLEEPLAIGRRAARGTARAPGSRSFRRAVRRGVAEEFLGLRVDEQDRPRRGRSSRGRRGPARPGCEEGVRSAERPRRAFLAADGRLSASDDRGSHARRADGHRGSCLSARRRGPSASKWLRPLRLSSDRGRAGADERIAVSSAGPRRRTAAGTGDDRGMVTAHVPAHEFRGTPNIGECWT